MRKTDSIRIYIASEAFTLAFDANEANLGTIDVELRRIIISTQCPPDCLLEVVLKLAYRGWYTLGLRARSPEERAAQFSMIGGSVLKSILRHGGYRGLRRAQRAAQARAALISTPRVQAA